MLGAFLYLTPAAVGASLLVFVGVVAWSRFISLGSIVAAGLFPLAVFLLLHSAWPIQTAALICGAFIIWRHEANIGRLRAGTENVFRFGRSRGPA
jgi:glycerol-3-phosphate acyltransferase PlsY